MLYFRYIYNPIKTDELVDIWSLHTCKRLQHEGFILKHLWILVKLIVFQFHLKLMDIKLWKVTQVTQKITYFLDLVWLLMCRWLCARNPVFHNCM